MKKNLLILILASLIYFVFAQESLKSTEEEFYDFLSLTGQSERPTLGYRTLSDSTWKITNKSHVWAENNLGTKYTLWENETPSENWFANGIDQCVKLKVYGPEWYNSYNTNAPYGQNDGALWQGKGFNTSFSTGARLEAYGFELTFKPQVSWSQNKEFDLISNHCYGSVYSYFQPEIDFPQRFGDESLKSFDFGDSEIRYTWHTLTIGAGFQNPWLGSAWLNPILGSNNAPSYPKIDAGLRKTGLYLPFCGLYIGDIEGRIWVGRLEESLYFDNNPDNNYRILTGISASFEPSFVPNLTVGVNRIFIANWAAHNLKYVGRLFTLSHSNGSQVGTHEDEDQKVAMFADWHFPSVGFEVWGEIGIDDFTSDKVANPFHTAIYSVGVKQMTPMPVDWLKGEIISEWNNFEMSQDFQLQWTYTGYYSHGAISQGYTNKGQILGAGTGSLGNSQFLGYKIYHPYGSVMLFYHRYCPDNNYIFNMAVDADASADSENKTINKDYYARYRTYRTYGISVTQYIAHNFMINASLTRIFIAHSLYTQLNSMGISASLSAKYSF